MGDLVSVSLENGRASRGASSGGMAISNAVPRGARRGIDGVAECGRIREANDAVREITGVDPVHVGGAPRRRAGGWSPTANAPIGTGSNVRGTPTRLEAGFQPDAENPSTRRMVALAMTRLPEADPPSVLSWVATLRATAPMRGRLMESDPVGRGGRARGGRGGTRSTIR